MTKIHEAIDIQFTDLTYEVQDGIRGPKKQILKGLSGFFKSGELTAVMGPSGAGKSTLLNILSGFYSGKLSGKIEYIGNAGKQNWQMYKKVSCYIQQMDSLYDLFTIKETMTMAAHMKIDNNSLNENNWQRIIDNILDTLSLLRAKNTRVNRLSGGQRKRLSIALELLSSPQIMFLDEPITGLDSLSSFQCVNILRTLSEGGRTMICTIHQPSSIIYQLFDYIYVVANGQCIYAGTPTNTVNYFAQQGFVCPKSYNPADYMIEIISREYGNHDERLITVARQHCNNRDNVKSMKIKETLINNKRETIISPSEFTKFWILLRRCVILLYRDWTVSQLRLVVHFLMAVLLGLLFENAGSDGGRTLNNVGYMHVNLVYIIYTSMIPAVLKFPSELAILKKERFNNWYQLRTYYIAMLVSSVPLQAFSTFIYSTVSYWLSSQPLEWSRFFMYLLISILTSIIAEGTGMGLGTILNPINGTFIGAISLCAMIAIGGFLSFFSHMPTILYYVSYLNYLRYSFDGILQALYGNHRGKLDCRNQEYCHYRVPSTLLEEMSMSKPTFWMDVIVLFIHVVIVRIIVYLMLKRKLSKIC